MTNSKKSNNRKARSKNHRRGTPATSNLSLEKAVKQNESPVDFNATESIKGIDKTEESSAMQEPVDSKVTVDDSVKPQDKELGQYSNSSSGTEKLARCGICGNKFERIREHMQSAHGIGSGAKRQYICSECGKSFPTPEEKLLHMEIHQKKSTEEKRKPPKPVETKKRDDPPPVKKCNKKKRNTNQKNGPKPSAKGKFKGPLEPHEHEDVNQKIDELNLKKDSVSEAISTSPSKNVPGPTQVSKDKVGLESPDQSLNRDDHVNNPQQNIIYANEKPTTSNKEDEHTDNGNGVTDQTSNENKVSISGQDFSMVKHPLQHSWSFWYFKLDKSKRWEDNLRKVMDVSTVEDFWAVYNHIQLLSKLNVGCDYALFKKGIEPTWEDEANKDGGRWLMTLDVNDFRLNGDLDYLWREVLMFLVGGEIETDIINGAVVNIRNKEDKISLWLSVTNPLEGSKILDIGKQFKARLGLHESHRVLFETHKEAQNKRGFVTRSEYTI